MNPADGVAASSAAEAPAELSAGCRRLDPGPGWQLDSHLDRSGAAEEPVLSRTLDPQHDTPVARGRSIPFRFGGPRREELPDDGWDRLMTWAYNDFRSGAQVSMASVLEILIGPKYLGTGLSYRILAVLREAPAGQGITVMVAPVRPKEKHLVPHLPMTEYIKLTRPDGLPQDAWLRVHVRAGAVIEKVAPASMVMAGSLARWRAWTGQPFDTDGDVIVPAR